MNDALIFCYWLNGYADGIKAPPNEEQWKKIREMLDTALDAQTPMQSIINKYGVGGLAGGWAKSQVENCTVTNTKS